MRRISGNYLLKNRVVDFDFMVPATWDELERTQMATILQVLSYGRADKYTIVASLITLLCGENWRHITNLPDEELHALMPLTNFLFETKPPVRNLYPKLNLRKKACFPPAEDLSNIGFGEWCFAYEAWNTYNIHKEPSFLDKLVAILYRPADPSQRPGSPDFSGDIREKFNENLIAYRERDLKANGEKEKIAVYTWFTAALIQVMDARPNLFPAKPEDFNEVLTNAGDENHDWFSAFRELMGPKWGQEDKLKYTNAMFVLDAMDESIRNSKTLTTPAE